VFVDGAVVKLTFAYNAEKRGGWFRGGGGRDGTIVELYYKPTSATRNLVFRNGTWGSKMDGLDYVQAERSAPDQLAYNTPDFASGTDAVPISHRVWEDAGRLFAEFTVQFAAWRITRTYIVYSWGDITAHARITLTTPGDWAYLGRRIHFAAARYSVVNGPTTYNWGTNYQQDGESFHAFSDGAPTGAGGRAGYSPEYYRYSEPLRAGLNKNTAATLIGRMDPYSGFMLDDRNGNDPDILVMNGDPTTWDSPISGIARAVGGNSYVETGIFSPAWAPAGATHAGMNWFYRTISCCPPAYDRPMYWPGALGSWEEVFHIFLRPSGLGPDDYLPLWRARARNLAQEAPTAVQGARLRLDPTDRLYHFMATPGTARVQFQWTRSSGAPRSLDYRTAFVVDQFPDAAWVQIQHPGPYAPALTAQRNPVTGRLLVVLTGVQPADPVPYTITIER
jgi:hypothetical protein